MIPRQANLGRSFLGAGKYYLHDIDAETSVRVTFTHTENIPTKDPHKALKWMAWTAIHAEELKEQNGWDGRGERCQKPVLAFSLSWHPEQEPDLHKWKMIEAGRGALIALGLDQHEALFVGHSDSAPHVHVIVNTINPETGIVNNLPFSKIALSKWAEDYERQHGKIYCEQRVENNERRAEGEFVQYQEPELDLKAQITKIYHASPTGAAFQEGIKAAGLRLAQGKRIVVIDQDGKIHSLSRQIEGAKAKEIRAKLADLVLTPVDDMRSEPEEVNPTSAQPESQEIEAVAKPDPKQSANDNDPLRAKKRKAWRDPSSEQQETPFEILSSVVANAKPKVSDYQIDALKSRHIDEWCALTRRHAVRRDKTWKGIREGRLDESNLREQITELENALGSGKARRAWLRFTRQIPKDPEAELIRLREYLERVERIQDHSTRSLDDDIHRDRRQLEARHYWERRQLQPDNPDYFRSDKTSPFYERPVQNPPEPQEDLEFDPDDGPYLD
jgi:hypothetical protein